MALCCGIDFHSTNHWLTVIDKADHRVSERRLPSDLAVTLAAPEPYWLVDGLIAGGNEVKRVNTSVVRRYDGLQYFDDRRIAFQLADLLRLGILPTG